jgi:hypothetical protein
MREEHQQAEKDIEQDPDLSIHSPNDDLDEGERKVLEKKMETLVDLYYLALDAAKTGMKVNSAFHYTQFLVSTAFM